VNDDLVREYEFCPECGSDDIANDTRFKGHMKRTGKKYLLCLACGSRIEGQLANRPEVRA
jgi:hypothetical protein